MGHGSRDVRAAVVYGVEVLGRGVNAGLERVGGLVHGPLGNGNQAHEVGQVGNGSFQPAGGREPLHAGGRGSEDAVGEAGGGEGGAEIGGVADFRGIAQGNGRLDGTRMVSHAQAEARAGLRFDVGGGQVFGFDDDRRAAGVGDEQVGLQAGAARDDAGILEQDAAARQHGLQQAAQGVIGIRLGLARHRGGPLVVAPGQQSGARPRGTSVRG